jgi:hypothetical protein
MRSRATRIDNAHYPDAAAAARFGSDIAEAGLEPEDGGWRAWVETTQGDIFSQRFASREQAAIWANL